MVSPTSTRCSASCACTFGASSYVYAAAAHADGAHAAACCCAPLGHLRVGRKGPGLHGQALGQGCMLPGSCRTQLCRAAWSCRGSIRYAGDFRRQLLGCCRACASHAAAARPCSCNAWGCRERTRRRMCCVAGITSAAAAGLCCCAGLAERASGRCRCASLCAGREQGGISMQLRSWAVPNVQPCTVMSVRHA